MSPVEQIAKANQASIEQGKPEDGDPVSVPDDASWLPPTRGRTAEVEDVPEEKNEQDLQDQIQTKWPQVHSSKASNTSHYHETSSSAQAPRVRRTPLPFRLDRKFGCKPAGLKLSYPLRRLYHRQIQIDVVNPKSITVGELYGQFNPFTMEWRDGVGSSLMRRAATTNSKVLGYTRESK